MGLQTTGLHSPVKSRHMAAKHIAGYRIDMDPEAPGGLVEFDTFQCCHCAMHFDRILGKGPPAMCLREMQPTCGQKKCDPCWPWEAKLEMMEGTRQLSEALEAQFNFHDSVF